MIVRLGGSLLRVSPLLSRLMVQASALLVVIPMLSSCGGSNAPTEQPKRLGCAADMARVPVIGGTGSAFCLDKTEVTVSSYAECIGKAQCTATGPGRDCNEDTPLTQTHPVNCVDWKQANTFCQAAGKRLPSEDEWDAAVAQQEISGGICWSGTRPLPGTCPVDRKGGQVSPQGVGDLSGNVAEWTSTGPLDARVIRGGFWSANDASVLRSESRRTAKSVDRSPAVGFRCARDF